MHMVEKEGIVKGRCTFAAQAKEVCGANEAVVYHVALLDTGVCIAGEAHLDSDLLKLQIVALVMSGMDREEIQEVADQCARLLEFPDGPVQ